MKNTKLVLSLGIITLLTSCGASSGKEVTRADAEKLFADSTTATSAEGYELPKKFTLNATIATSGTMSYASDEAGTYSVSYDGEKKYSHYKKTSNDKSEETWAYVKDDACEVASITVVGSSTTKQRSSSSSGYFDKSAERVTRFLYLSPTYIAAVKGRSIELDGTASSSSSSAKIEESYHSTGAGNVMVSVTRKGDTVGSLSQDSSYELKMNNNMVTSFTSHTKNTDGSSQDVSMSFDWSKCDLSYPNLDDFSEGVGGTD